MSYITFENVIKSYGSGTAQINALDGVDFEINKGEFCILLGSSGAGKTTLLNMLGGMDTITSGRIEFDGMRIRRQNCSGALNVSPKEKICPLRSWNAKCVILIKTVPSTENYIRTQNGAQRKTITFA